VELVIVSRVAVVVVVSVGLVFLPTLIAAAVAGRRSTRRVSEFCFQLDSSGLSFMSPGRSTLICRFVKDEVRDSGLVAQGPFSNAGSI
jgi:hypothetical protein